MSSSVPIDVGLARNAAATNGHDCFIEIGSGNILPPDKWFMHLVHDLWGQDDNSPAKWLRSLTGFPERTCRSAANGHTDVSSAMLYALWRGEQGNRVAAHIMRDSAAQWWLEQQRAAEVGRKVLAITK